MKPIVIYPKDNGDKITLTKKEFEEYLKQAYDAGYSDGYSAGRAFNWQFVPITQTQPNITWETTPNDFPNPYKITCDNDKNLAFAPGGNITKSNLFVHGDDAVEKITSTNNTLSEIALKVIKDLGEEK